MRSKVEIIEEMKALIAEYEAVDATDYGETIKLPEKEIGFHSDGLFLLSEKEYKEYVNIIPEVKCSWWLRDTGYDSQPRYVDRHGALNLFPSSVSREYGIRPGLRIRKEDLGIPDEFLTLGTHFCYMNVDFTIIDIANNLGLVYAIATVPVSFEPWTEIFLNEKEYDYYNSDIRRRLVDLDRNWATFFEE